MNKLGSFAGRSSFYLKNIHNPRTNPIPNHSALKAFSVAKDPKVNPKNFGPLNDDAVEPRFLEQVKLYFDKAGKNSNIPEEWLTYIKSCAAIVRFNIPLVRDNGKLETITCYR
jgi:hypothetical protein